MSYKIHVLDRKYSKWELYNSSTLDLEKKEIEPVENKLFNHDVFSIKDGKISIDHSVIRNVPSIQGVLVLEGCRTYGRHSRDKFYYRCIPDDRRLPEFLVPYKLKIGFSKTNVNKYILFKYKNWDNKHPIGTIIQVIGPVSDLSCFYEYQLYCKSLYASIQQFNAAAMKSLRHKSSNSYIDTIQKKYKLENRQDWDVYSIDPEGSRDFDDAFSIKKMGDEILLSIYISNVCLWMDVMDLWGSFSKRIATIYLPDRKRPMLPTILSDALCSLLEKNIRFAFTLDCRIKDGIIINCDFKNTSVVLKKNHIYDSNALNKNKDYKLLFDVVTKMNTIENQEYISKGKCESGRKIKDSHDIIAYIMVLMNYTAGKKLETFGTGIFRSIKLDEKQSLPKNLPNDVIKFITGWTSSGGRYVKFGDYRNHDLLKIHSYVHITSPIRRLVDLLNMIELQDKLGLLKYNEKSKEFYEKWFLELDYINTTMRSIRKVQNNCSLLDKCVKEENPQYDGFLFDKMERNDGLFQYMVYLPKIRMTNRLVSQFSYENYSKHLFKIYTFMDEDQLKQKVRIDIISSYSIYENKASEEDI